MGICTYQILEFYLILYSNYISLKNISGKENDFYAFKYFKNKLENIH